MIGYPPVGFHFMVEFFLDGGPNGIDIGFQEVSGLAVELETEALVEGGENRFTHELPVRTKFQDLVLKRGLAPATSDVFKWVKESIESKKVKPVNIKVTLMNEEHDPLSEWEITNAYPKRWEVSAFNAEQSSAVIETLTLAYQYFTHERIF